MRWLRIRNLAVIDGGCGGNHDEFEITQRPNVCSPAAVIDARLSLRTRASASLLAVFRSDAQSSPSWQRLLSVSGWLGSTSNIV